MYASVVVPTYNRRKNLERTINALLNQTVSCHAFEIIVVDDCSVDDTQAYMNSILSSASNLKYIRHPRNEGRVATRNDGVSVARGDVIIFLDDDNVPDLGFVEMHLSYNSRCVDEHLAVMGNASFAPEIVEGSNFAKYLQSRYLGNRLPRQRKGLDYLDLPANCLGTLNCSMQRIDFLAAGMLNNSFRDYGGEDVYLGYCLKEIGVRIIFGEKARSLHYDDVSLLRYKSKIVEASQGGLKIILRQSPEFFENTQLRFLLPINKDDSLSRTITKLIIKIFLNPATIFVLEHFALLIDHNPFLYFPLLYRLLLAGWSLQGLKSNTGAIRLVRYGEEG